MKWLARFVLFLGDVRILFNAPSWRLAMPGSAGINSGSATYRSKALSLLVNKNEITN